jgi:transcriptional regulator with XRE-family HTH domain
MMLSEDAVRIRNKIIGVLLQRARLDAKMSIEACAHALGCEAALIAKAERGEVGLTLPQLESLGHLLGVPLSYFLDTEELPEVEEGTPLVPYAERMALRDRIIGVQLRQARQEAGQELEEVAAALGYTPDQLEDIELSQAPVGIVELQALAEELGTSVAALGSDDLPPPPVRGSDGPEQEWPDHLSPELIDFLVKPIHLPYLRIAMNLSAMPADTLRQIASGLLEITY